MRKITEIRYQVWSARNPTRYEHRLFVDGECGPKQARAELKERVHNPAVRMFINILSLNQFHEKPS